MKTYRQLYERLYAFENLYLAFRKARRGKRRRFSVAAFEANLEAELFALGRELRDETYRPGPYRHFTLYESKPRRISAAPFRDRVVHHAVCNLIEPIWERRFIHDSYACRKGKGVHAAMDKAQRYLRCHAYVLQADVVQFFPSIDHEILYHLLARHIADRRLLALIRRIIDSGAGIHRRSYRMQWFPDDDLFAQLRPRGLPIGNQTSQFWSNVYLHELDEFVKRRLRCRAFVRYCDDFLLFSEHKAELHQWRGAIEAKLAELRLRIHANRTSVHPATRGTPFLGFTLFPNKRRLARDNALRFRRRFARLLDAYGHARIDRADMDAAVRGWVGHARHGDTWGLRRAILGAKNLPLPGRR